MRIEVGGVATPEAYEQQGGDRVGTLPHLAEAGASLLAQLIGMGEPEHGAADGRGPFGIVEGIQPVPDALHGDSGLPRPSRQRDDRAMATVVDAESEGLPHLVLEVLEWRQRQAPLQVLERGWRLIRGQPRQSLRKGRLLDEIERRGLARVPAFRERHTTR